MWLFLGCFILVFQVILIYCDSFFVRMLLSVMHYITHVVFVGVFPVIDRSQFRINWEFDMSLHGLLYFPPLPRTTSSHKHSIAHTITAPTITFAHTNTYLHSFITNVVSHWNSCLNVRVLSASLYTFKHSL